ncbi:hypothetical protein IJ847_00715 [Candidatus Saccharibacteria bacterium]|nr:hypothetical protein [Candidatus Saccharibacteria bacterium]
MTAISSYQSNNSNHNPFISTDGEDAGVYGKPTADQITNFVKRYIDGECAKYEVIKDKSSNGARSVLYNTTTCGSQFSDPDGEPYQLDIRLDKVIQATDGEVKYPQDATGDAEYTSTVNGITHRITVFSKAKCDTREGHVVQTSGKNDIAVFYVLEGGSIACTDNQ